MNLPLGEGLVLARVDPVGGAPRGSRRAASAP